MKNEFDQSEVRQSIQIISWRYGVIICMYPILTAMNHIEIPMLAATVGIVHLTACAKGEGRVGAVIGEHVGAI